MTNYIFHYDLENAEICPKAAVVLRELHKKFQIPATFFCLGKVLEQRGPDLLKILGDTDLFDIQSHTYSHQLLRDSKMHGPGVSLDELRKEVSLGKRLVEDVFQRECIGIRSGCGFYRGLQGEPERLAIVVEEGAKYISTDLRGPADSIPSGLVQAYWYDEDASPGLLEMPGHGWHDNVLKMEEFYCLLSPWPRYVEWGIPRRPVKNPEEEFEVQKMWIDHAVQLGLDYVSLVYHPCSIFRMSPDCRIIEHMMRYVTDQSIPATTYTQLYRQYADSPASVPGRNAWTWESEKQTGDLW